MSALYRLMHALRTSTSAAGELRLSPAQLIVLHAIAREPGQSLMDYAGRTLSGQSAMSEAVSALVRRGLVSRRTMSFDRRRALLRPTEAGHTALAAAPEPVQARLARTLREMSPASRKAITLALEEWLAAAGIDEFPRCQFLEDPA